MDATAETGGGLAGGAGPAGFPMAFAFPAFVASDVGMALVAIGFGDALISGGGFGSGRLGLPDPSCGGRDIALVQVID